MKCPSCGNEESKVVDSRPTGDSEIRRRRECLACGKRFTTYEVLEEMPIVVIKKDGTKQLFDRAKILNGLSKACYKRPVAHEAMEKLINDIEQELHDSYRNEISTFDLGTMVLERLKELDEVSYIRFASVYREFNDVESFVRELANLKKNK